MIFREAWLPYIAMGAVVVLLVSAVAITWEGGVFHRTAQGKAIPLNLPNGVSRPGLAMELARDNTAARNILYSGVDQTADPQIQALQKEQNRRAMAAMQWWDFPFIAAYVMLFLVIAQRASLLGFTPLKVIAFLAGVTAVAAGCADVLEDVAILNAISTDCTSSWHIWPFGYAKWFLVFITMLLESSVFLAWTSLPTPQRVLTLLVGGGFFGVGMLGIQSMLLQCDSSIELDATWLFGVFALLTAFSIWRFIATVVHPPAAPAAG